MSGDTTGARSPSTHKDHLYKILVIGEFGVGKTSIIRRYTEGYFSPNYKLTIGVDFALKTLEWGETSRVNLQLWDIAGHERFGHMTRVYYKYAIGAIIVFDLSRQATFEAVLKWLEDVNSKVMLQNEQPIPVLLLANKCDLENASIDTNKLNHFIKQHRIIAWFPTSAKDNINIDDAIQYLVKHITAMNAENGVTVEPLPIAKPNTLVLTDADDEENYQETKSKSCC